MKIFDTCLIIERMKESAGKETDKFLLEIFGIAQNTLSGWKSRNSIPLQAIITFSNKYDVSIDWLITGKERKQEPELDELSKGLLERFQALDFEGKLAILNAVTNKSAVNSGSVSQTQSGVGNVQVNQK